MKWATYAVADVSPNLFKSFRRLLDLGLQAESNLPNRVSVLFPEFLVASVSVSEPRRAWQQAGWPNDGCDTRECSGGAFIK